jgi:hypothetical protein
MKKGERTDRHRYSIIILALFCAQILFSCSPASSKGDVPAPTPGVTSSTMVQRASVTTAAPSPTPKLAPSWTPRPTRTAFHVELPFASGAFIIGSSVSGRPIDVYRFGTGSVERLIVAGIHGGSEANTTQLAYELMNYISEHPDVIPDGVTLYILPCLNPDGAARSQDANGRVNDNGVDLNRNWDANWQADWPRDGCWNQGPSTAGPLAMSEPETIALANFIRGHHFDAILSYHSAGLGIFAGGQPPLEASIRLAEAVAAVSPYPYPPVDTGCLYTGGLVDWAANQGIAALDIELSTHVGTDFDINLAILNAFLAWR